MIDLLEISSLKFECVSGFCGVQEMEGVNSVVVGIIIIGNGVLDPALFKKSIAHILVLSQNSKDLFRRI